MVTVLEHSIHIIKNYSSLQPKKTVIFKLKHFKNLISFYSQTVFYHLQSNRLSKQCSPFYLAELFARLVVSQVRQWSQAVRQWSQAVRQWSPLIVLTAGSNNVASVADV